MSTISVQAIAGRVVLVHDMPNLIIHSELDVEQADMLLEALERAKHDVLRMMAQQSRASLATILSGIAGSASS